MKTEVGRAQGRPVLLAWSLAWALVAAGSAPGAHAAPRSLELAKWLAPGVLVRLILDEHPQVIAALLLLIEPEPAAAVLAMLPLELQTLVVERVAKEVARATIGCDTESADNGLVVSVWIHNPAEVARAALSALEVE